MVSVEAAGSPDKAIVSVTVAQARNFIVPAVQTAMTSALYETVHNIPPEARVVTISFLYFLSIAGGFLSDISMLKETGMCANEFSTSFNAKWQNPTKAEIAGQILAQASILLSPADLAMVSLALIARDENVAYAWLIAKTITGLAAVLASNAALRHKRAPEVVAKVAKGRKWVGNRVKRIGQWAEDNFPIDNKKLPLPLY